MQPRHVGTKKQSKISVFYQVKTLLTIESELLVAGEQCQMLSDGMRDDDMIRRISVPHSIIQSETGIGDAYMPSQRQKLDFKFILHKAYDILCPFPTP